MGKGHQEVETHTTARASDFETEFRLPITDPAPRQTIGDVIIESARPVLYETLGRTETFDREHAFAVATVPNAAPPFSEMVVTEIVEGQAESITGAPRSPSTSIIGANVHTHPVPGNAGFSYQDYTSMAVDLLQFPPEKLRQLRRGGAKRAFGVLTQRPGDDQRGVAVLNLVKTKDKAFELDIDQQRERSQELFDSAKEKALLASAETVIEPVSDLLAHEFREFEVPDSVERLNFRSAIPPEVSDREFGNAFADGDLTDVLDGVRYL
jgi:hypothetical protein